MARSITLISLTQPEYDKSDTMEPSSKLCKSLKAISILNNVIILMLCLMVMGILLISPSKLFYYDSSDVDFIDQHTDLHALKEYAKKIITRSNTSSDRFDRFILIVFWSYILLIMLLILHFRYIKKLRSFILSDRTEKDALR